MLNYGSLLFCPFSVLTPQWSDHIRFVRWTCVCSIKRPCEIYSPLPFGKQRRVKWCLFCTLLTISGVLWCLLSVRLYKAIVSVHMFVCEIPDKALIIREEQGHNGELLIYIYIFFFPCKGYEYAELNHGERDIPASRFMAKTVAGKYVLDTVLVITGLYCNFILHTHKQLKWNWSNFEPKSWFRFFNWDCF